jgi:hypothetical protein
MPGVEWLYLNDDPDNQPQKIAGFDDDLEWINSFGNQEARRKGFIRRFVTPVADRMQILLLAKKNLINFSNLYYILYSNFAGLIVIPAILYKCQSRYSMSVKPPNMHPSF